MAALLPAGISEPCHSRWLHGKPAGRFADCALRVGASVRGPIDWLGTGPSDDDVAAIDFRVSRHPCPDRAAIDEESGN